MKTEDTDVFDSPRDPSALDLQEGHVCFFLNEKLSGGTEANEINAERKLRKK
jgi:hypothetical protein